MATMRTMVAVGLLLAVAAGDAGATDVKILGTHNAKFNIDGTVLGAYRDHTPLVIQGVKAGEHKLYAKSLITGELQLFQFTATGAETAPLDYKADFAPPREDKNDQARRRTMLGGSLLVSEVAGDSSTGRQDRRKVIGGLAVANELIKGAPHDRQYSAKYGNTLEIKTQEDVDINVDGVKGTFKVNEAKRWHNLEPGEHKVYIRNIGTGELKYFLVEFPGATTETITLRPNFAPPKGETVNAKARRRTGLLGGLVLNELLSSKEDKQQRRAILLGGTAVNEVVPTNAGRHRAQVVLDLTDLGEVPMSIEGDEGEPEATDGGAAN